MSSPPEKAGGHVPRVPHQIAPMGRINKWNYECELMDGVIVTQGHNMDEFIGVC